MKNSFIINNFLKTKVPEVSFDYKTGEKIREFISSQIESNEFSIEIKNCYITALLTGALFIKPEDKKSVIEQLVALEMYSPVPLIHFIEIPFYGIVSQYNVFNIVRDELWKKEPELILEIAKKQYNRVWTGWTNDKDIGNIIYAANYFWEPVAKILLEDFAGCRSIVTESNNTIIENTLYRSLTAFLQSGKSGHFGVPLNILMAGIGNITSPIPVCINTKNRINEINCRVNSGNGYTSYLPSIMEEFYSLNI
ncbi:MAG: hypothetical protein MJZ50_03155 [Treponema sp.]|nr:hypothetical protein [Treponema sp.]